MNANSSLKTCTDPISVGGITPLTSTDYPGKLAAVLFCQGCPLRCLYCHNPQLQLRFLQDKNLNKQNNSRDKNLNSAETISWNEVIAFLKKRRGLLDAVVFSGGEPCMQENLYSAIEEAKDLGFKIGLHTAGVYPERLEEVLPLLDWVGFDIKQIFSKYAFITGTAVKTEKFQRCIKLLVDSEIDFECRTTVHSELITLAEVRNIAYFLKDSGIKKYVLQAFNKIPEDTKNLNDTHRNSFFNSTNIEQIKSVFPNLEVRGIPRH